MIKITPYNETYVRVTGDDDGILMEMSDYFTFFVPGYRYHPKFKNKMWDGKIKLIGRSGLIYKGLVGELIKFFQANEYEFSIDITLKNHNDLSMDQVRAYIDSLDLHGRGNKIDVRDYQYEAVYQALHHDRSLLLSPTASGKSLIIYSIIRWHIEQDHKILVVVPTTMLANQLFTDFEDYSSANGFDVEDNMSVLYSGKERVFDKPVVISTWQSLASMMKSDPKNFAIVVNRTEVGVWDEAHSYKANIVLSVMEKFINTKYRVGTTGTIDDSKINGLVLQGLMGPVYKVISTKQLMDNGQIVQLDISCLMLMYPEHIRKEFRGMDYKEEINFLVGYEARNRFIARLATTVPGNTMVLFNFVERHGKVLDAMIREITDRPVYFIHGKVDVEAREEIRQLLNTHDNAIVVATSSLMSTGVNVVSLQNIIFATPSKSTIRVRQSIGRGLRLNKGKTVCRLFDISDDISWKSYKNTTLKHLEDRLTIYAKEQFQYSIKKLPIG